MLASLCLALCACPLPVQEAQQAQDLGTFQSLAVEYIQGGAPVRAWFDEEVASLRELFRVLDRQSEGDAAFEPARLSNWPLAWTFVLKDSGPLTLWPAGPNQLHHDSWGRLTLGSGFTREIERRIAALGGAPISLRAENPIPKEHQERTRLAVELLDQDWNEVILEHRFAEPIVTPLPGDRGVPRLLAVGAGAPLPDGGALIRLLPTGNRPPLKVRRLHAGRARLRVLGHQWVHVAGAGAFWIPDEWLRRWHPELPSLALAPDLEARQRALQLLGQPDRLPLELDRLLVETQPLEGEHGPPRFASKGAPVSRLPTRVWYQLEFEALDLDDAGWLRLIADAERQGAARIQVYGDPKTPWSFGLVPLSETSALVPYLGRVSFPGPAWADVAKVVALELGLEAESIRLAPR